MQHVIAVVAAAAQPPATKLHILYFILKVAIVRLAGRRSARTGSSKILDVACERYNRRLQLQESW